MEERYYATGRRKTAVARVWVTQGSGQIKVNNRTVEEYFGEAVRQQALKPLTSLGVEGEFDIWCTVKGGGISGQAGALRHGLARALVVANEDYRKPLRKHGFLTRDSRMVERKKYGQPGARKRFQFLQALEFGFWTRFLDQPDRAWRFGALTNRGPHTGSGFPSPDKSHTRPEGRNRWHLALSSLWCFSISCDGRGGSTFVFWRQSWLTLV